MMVEFDTDGQYPHNNAAECHTDAMIRSQINRSIERTIWEYQSSMELERKLRINQREGGELSRSVTLEKERKFRSFSFVVTFFLLTHFQREEEEE